MGNTFLDAALGYTERDWPVFPVIPNGKEPHPGLGKDAQGKGGVYLATTDRAQITTWWTQWPDANIGIACGAHNGHAGPFVLDIDNKHGKDGSGDIQALERQYGTLPNTPAVFTPNNGEHRYFADDARIHGKVNGKLYGYDSLDLQGTGCYVVAPPSVVDGKAYHEDVVYNFDDVDLAPLPQWLIDGMPDKAPDAVPVAPSGKPLDVSSLTVAKDIQMLLKAGDVLDQYPNDRSAMLFALECALIRTGYGDDDLVTVLMNSEHKGGAKAQEQGDKWLRTDIARARAEVAKDTTLKVGGAKAQAPAVQPSIYSANSANCATAWPPLIPFVELTRPAFPVQALPDVLQAYVMGLAHATQTPPDLAGLLSLAVCATAIAGKVVVQVKPGYQEPVNFFTAIALPPGSRKSAVFAAVTAPLDDYERRQAIAFASQIAEAESQYRILEKALQKAETDAAKPPKGDTRPPGERLEDAKQKARELAEFRIPQAPRLYTDDITPERLASLIAVHNGRMAVLSAEGGDVFDMMRGRYSKNNQGNFGVYLRGHAGDTLKVDRGSRPAEHVKSPALTVALAIQPDVLHGLHDQAGPGTGTRFRGRGLLGRFWYSQPANMLGHRETQPAPLAGEVRNAYHRLVSTLLEMEEATDDQGAPVPHVLMLHPAACARLQTFEKELEPQLATFGTYGHMTDWAGKLLGAVARLAGTLHLIAHAHDGEPWKAAIRHETVENAMTLGNYLAQHAKAAYADMGADPAIADAQYLLRWITREPRTTFTKRDVFEQTKGRFKRVEAMEPGLALLAAHGYLRLIPPPARPGPGRKPSPVYEIHPDVTSAERAESQSDSASHNSHNPPEETQEPQTDFQSDSASHNSHNSHNTSAEKQEPQTDFQSNSASQNSQNSQNASAEKQEPQTDFQSNSASQNSQNSQNASSAAYSANSANCTTPKSDEKQPVSAFQDFQASVLYCQNCKQATDAIPNPPEYLCAVCGDVTGQLSGGGADTEYF